MDASTFTEEAIMSINVRLLTVSLAILLACSTPPGWGAGSSAGASRGGADAANLDFQAGLAAAQAKDWTVVVARMTAVTQQDPKNANAWNELGHAYRLLGDMDNSFKNYARALEIDPRHKGAHEYLGEAYLQVGKLDMAEKELQALDKICFISCEEYRGLKEQIVRYKRGRLKAMALR
jgi:cytochrome c-type biogenesis protein CcmH/NrfG